MPPVEMNTTVLVSNPAARAVAKASQRYVYGDFRLVEMPGGAMPATRPHSWRPRSCCAPVVGDCASSASRERSVSRRGVVGSAACLRASAQSAASEGFQACGNPGCCGNRKSTNAAAVGCGS